MTRKIKFKETNSSQDGGMSPYLGGFIDNYEKSLGVSDIRETLGEVLTRQICEGSISVEKARQILLENSRKK